MPTDPYKSLPDKVKAEIDGQPQGPKPKKQDLLTEAYRHKTRAGKLEGLGDTLRANYWRTKEQEKLAEAEGVD